MTAWDILDKFISNFPPIAATVLFVVAAVIFVVGFSRHGVNFIKYGFKQMVLDSTIEKRFDDMESKFDDRFTQIDNRILAIETNHFGHLKNFLTELTGILLDKDIINNSEKARLDNQLRGM